MNKNFIKIWPLMMVGIVLVAVDMVFHATSLTAVSYIIEGVGIVVLLIFCLLTGFYIGKNKTQK